MRILHIGTSGTGNEKKQSKLEVLCEQILDSVIVAGISGLSAYLSAGEDASLKAIIIGFILTFLIKMKEYRNVK